MRSTMRRRPSASRLAADLERQARLAGEAAAGFLDRASRGPASSKHTMRAPMSMAVSSTTSPASHTAIFEVPPPMSTFITRADSRIERAAAPEP